MISSRETDVNNTHNNTINDIRAHCSLLYNIYNFNEISTNQKIKKKYIYFIMRLINK